MADQGPEVRIGLVLYGGVSLAVYIYGVVIEVQRLLAAAAELERGERESAYAKALAASGASSASVDIVSGTSAGGINGILLAKALARRADLESARRLWVDDGDIAQLLQPPSVRDPRSLLQSGRFEAAVRKGLARFEREAGQGAVGEAPILDLFISATHLRGGPRLFEDSLGRQIHTRQHRYVFRRKLRRRNPDRGGQAAGYEQDDFRDDEVLVRLARATSAFPVAFEPVLIRTADGLFEDREADGWFADGGILNNKPFTEAVDAIVSRESDRPVRRWLFSLDPDPEPLEAESGPGEAPPFDQVALRSVATIPRYQSIARDLVALREHNERIDAADAAIRAGEAQRVDRDGGDDGSLGPGPRATYEVLRRQAWGKEVADALVKGAVRADGVATDWSEFHRGARLAAEGFDPEREGFEGNPDLAFQRRRIYYLIKLLSMAVAVQEGDSGAVREALWAQYETISRTLWEFFSGVEPERYGADGFEAGEIAARVLLGRLSERLLFSDGLGTEDLLGRALENVVVVLEEGDRFPVRLADVFANFESRDAMLLSAELYGGMSRRDRVRHAQISPLGARNTGVEEGRKLAGASLGHFGGFLDAGWRENDIMWGRLDGAEVLIRAVLNEEGREQAATLTDAVQEEVLATELPEVLAAPGGWKAGLQEHVGRGPAFGDLDHGRLVGIAFRAAAVVRRMLSTAARDSAAGGTANQVRAFLLRSAANSLGFVIALLYLPATAVFGKGMVAQRVATAAVFLPFLWGLATLLLGCIGVLPIDDVAVPAAIAIAIYPASLIAYWTVRGLVARIWRRRERSESGETKPGA